METYDVRFIHPFNMYVAGPSQSGKSYFVRQLVFDHKTLIDKPIDKIIWAYGVFQPEYNSLFAVPNLVFSEGMPDLESLKANKDKATLLILDDLAFETQNEQSVIFVKGSHHWNLSLISITQNLFSKNTRTSRINAHYLVLFKNPADRSQVEILQRQIYPGKKHFLIDAYLDATKLPHQYLLLDLKQTTAEEIHVHANIFDKNITVYVARK